MVSVYKYLINNYCLYDGSYYQDMSTRNLQVTLPRPLVNKLLAHAQHSSDREICGFITSKNGVPVKHYPIINIAETPSCRFRMDPKAQIDAMRQMRERHETLFAIYHSHPTSPAKPSAIDLQEAGYPEVLYLIISLNTKGVLELRGFRISGNAVHEVELEI